MARRKGSDPLLAALLKATGDGSFVELEESESRVRSWVSTSHVGLDMILGGRGLPGGRIVEFFGENASGKTLMLYTVARNIQANGGRAFICSTESSYSPELANAVGLVTDAESDQDVHPAVSVELGSKSKDQVFTIEEVFQRVKIVAKSIIDAGLEEEGPHIFGWDSFAATPPKKAVEENEHRFDMGLKAKALSEMLKVVTQFLVKADLMFVVINQARAGSIGQMYGPKIISPGGYALKHHSSVSIRFDRRKTEKSEEGKLYWPVKRNGQFFVEKSRFTPPNRSVAFIVPFGKPISRFSGLLDLAIDLGVVQRKSRGSSWLTWGEVSFRRKEFLEKVARKKAFRTELQKRIDEYV